jgi:hypothetical protein
LRFKLKNNEMVGDRRGGGMMDAKKKMASK